MRGVYAVSVGEFVPFAYGKEGAEAEGAPGFR